MTDSNTKKTFTTEAEIAAVPTTCRDMVKASRELARQTLRVRNVHTLTQRNNALNVEIAAAKEEITRNQKAVEDAKIALSAAKYDLGQLDANHPRFAQNTEVGEAKVTRAENDVAFVTKAATANIASQEALVAELNKAVEENTQKIYRWETGDNKVQLENLNELAHDYIEAAQLEAAKKLG